MSTSAAGSKRLLGLQCAITLAGAALSLYVASPQAAKSLAYGSLIALVSTLFLAWRAGRGEQQTAEAVVRSAYRTAIERMVMVAALLAAGFSILNPAWMLAGFLAGQGAWLVVPLLDKTERRFIKNQHIAK